MNSDTGRLEHWLRAKQRIACALSGGLDSSVLLAFGVRVLGVQNCAAFTVETPYTISGEIVDAEKLCARLGVNSEKIFVDAIPAEILYNPPERCYLCKSKLFGLIKAAAEKSGAGILCDGTNADDLSDYRPGMRALRELGVASPLWECGIGKRQIREIARALELDVAQKPSNSCLLTRLEHGKKIEPQTLGKIAMFEEFLRRIASGKIRARFEGGLVRIECERGNFAKIAEAAAEISAESERLGFKRCTLDLGGYKTGSMNIKQ